MKKLWQKFLAWLRGEANKKVKVEPDVKPEPKSDAVTPVECSCGPLGNVVEIPSSLCGGECVSMPFGRDIRFDGNYEKLTGKGFHFVGNSMKDACTVTKNPDGTFRVSCKCKPFEKEKVKGHIYGYNFPVDSKPITKGNVCESWNGDGTFRWYILFYKL